MSLMHYMQNMLEPTYVSIKINAVDILLPFTVGSKQFIRCKKNGKFPQTDYFRVSSTGLWICKSELLKQNFCFCKLFHQCIHFCSDKGLKRGFQSLHMSFCAVLQNPNCKSLDVIRDSWNKEGKSTKNVYCSGQLLFLNSWIHLSTFYVIVSLFSIWMTDQQQYKQNCPTQWLYHILSPSTKIEITAGRLAIPILLLHTATMTLPQLHIIYTSTYGVSAAAIFFWTTIFFFRQNLHISWGIGKSQN